MLDPKPHWNERKWLSSQIGLRSDPDKFRTPCTNLKPVINKTFYTKWQHRCNNNIHNKLFQIQPILGEWRPALRKSRREQVVISRLHFGHKILLTLSYWNKNNNQCLTSQTPCTIKHILKECRTFALIRKRFFKVNSLINLFENIKIDEVFVLLVPKNMTNWNR